MKLKKSFASFWTIIVLCSIVILLMNARDAHAQFNTTYAYTLSGVRQDVYCQDLVPSGKGTYWILSQVDTAVFVSNSGVQTILLKKMDVTGATIFNKVYRLLDDTTTLLTATKMIQTQDSGFIVVGNFFSTHFTFKNWNPYAAKFDKNGNFLWMHVYNSNPKTASFDNNLPYDARANITTVKDKTGEYYIIACSGEADSTDKENQNTYVNALEIDGNGILIWNKKYILTNGDTGVTYSIAPSAITFATQNGQNNSYFISGATDENTTKDFLFTFGINNAGAIIHNYTQYKIPSYTIDMCAIFDNDISRQKIIMSYSVGNQLVVPNTTSASVIGLMEVNPATYGIISNNFYYNVSPDDAEELCATITKTIQDDNYLLSTYSVYDPNSYSSGLLKVNAVTNAPIFWNYYNNIASAFGYSRRNFDISLLDNTGTNEYYIQASTRPYISTTLVTDLKVLGTNVAGSTCGVNPRSPQTLAQSFSPTSYIDTIRSYTGTLAVTLDSITPGITDTICMGDPTYRLSAPAGVATIENNTNDITVYPTLLNNGNNELNIKINKTEQDHISATLYNINGQKITQQFFNVQKGLNDIKWNLPIFQDGIYIVKIANEEGTMQKNIRITVL